jgi:hypothetical protein
VIQQANINQFQRLFQTFCNQPVGFTRFSLTRRVVMRKNDSSGIIFQTGFNDLTWMYSDRLIVPRTACRGLSGDADYPATGR